MTVAISRFFFAGCLAVLLCALFGISRPLAAESEAPGRITFGGDRAYPPFEWVERGTAKGFFIDLEAALGNVGRAEVRHEQEDWPDILDALETGKVDVVPMFISQERKKRFRFTAPFHFMTHAVYARAGTTGAVTVNDLGGRRIAVERSSYAYDRLVADGRDVQLVLTGNTREALMAVAMGRAEFAVLSIPVAEQLIRQNRFDVERVGPPFWPSGYAFAVRKDRVALADWLDASLESLIESGRYEVVYDQWKDRLEPGDTSWKQRLRTMALITGALLLLALLGVLWLVSLRRTVTARTAELRKELQRRQKAEGELRHMANHDSETGLPKYHRLLELLDALLRPAGDSAPPQREVVVLKLMEIEAIVRTFGYGAGRAVVREFAARLAQSGFDLTGYLGRGVFAAVGRAGTVQAAIRQATTRLDAEGLGLYPQVSCGVAHWPEHGADASEMIRHAETALAAGLERNQVWTVYNVAMEPDQGDLKLVTAFRETGGDGLHAAFQPQVDLATGRIVGAEALARWTHPELGAIPPARFIPILEKAGLVSMVTAAMIDKAAHMAARLGTLGHPCPISVNVAASDLLHAELLPAIRRAVAQHGIPAATLKLELTETSLAEDPAQVRRVLDELAGMGITASIDDFGTGYSSLSYLREFPLAEVKLDQSFVRDMVASPRNRCLVRSTIAMAHGLDLIVVAEGAEDQATLEALRDDGCDRVQGYVISRPLPEDAFQSFFECMTGG